MPPFLAYPRIPPPTVYPYKLFEEAGYSTGNSAQGTAITPSASANTKGSYSQVIAATTRRTGMLALTVTCYPVGANSKSFLVDIAKGAAASEVIIVPNLTIGCKGQFQAVFYYVRLPITIPAGTRLSARSQTQAASGEACFVKAILEDSPVVAMSGVDSFNASTSTSLGTAVTPGNAAESSYVQLIAATARAYRGFFATFDPQGAAGGNFPLVAFDFAIGGAGSEVVFFQNFMMFDQGGILTPNCTHFIPFVIPAGVRVAVRARGSGASNAIGVSAYGVY